MERLANTLADPQRIAPNISPLSAAAAVSLDGNTGVALFFAELARHDRVWLRAVHTHIAAAARTLAKGTPSAGLHLGPAAVLAAVQACAPLGGHYPRLRRRLVDHVAREQLRRIGAERAGRAHEHGVSWASYDAITGLSGTGRALLTAATAGGPDERAQAEPALRATLDRLVEISLPVAFHGHRVPGWWVPGHRQVTETAQAAFPRGDFNLGMAHGITGPLSLLTLCSEHGIIVPGQGDALHRIGGWLSDRVRADDAGPYWPGRIAFDDEVGWSRLRPPAGPALPRASWCYGAPGIATALWRAGAVTGTPAWQRLALDAVHALPRSPHAAHQQGDDAIVCHGDAGLLQAMWRLGGLAAEAELRDRAAEAGVRIVACADAEVPPASAITGILQGTAGIAAALLSLLPAQPTGGPHWDSVLLLS